MTPPPPELTFPQLKIYKELQTIRMAWVMLIAIVTLFTGGFGCFLWSAFFVPMKAGAKLILGGIDGLLGWALKAIVYYLFPQSSKNKPS